MRHLCSLFDLTGAEVLEILALAKDLKAQLTHGQRPLLFERKTLALVFEKPSLRTRTSFEVAAIQLGGGSTFQTAKDAGLNGRESVSDIARVMSSYTDAIALRTFSQTLIDDFAANSSSPIINALSDSRHPCQALTDLLTMQEVYGQLEGLSLVYVGDGNNVAASLAIASAMVGIRLTIAAPDGYQLDDDLLNAIRVRYPSTELQQVGDPSQAVRHANVVYTDVWASMGQESEANDRSRVFSSFQVNAELMALAPDDCRFMHDLPARRGLEVTEDVIDGPNSIVFQQAENRMHLAKALLAWLMSRD
ncbi:MAG: ornithine carbamoyltransferase [Planctomycetaceae bacterium]